ESGLTDWTQSLKYLGDIYSCFNGTSYTYCTDTSQNHLFSGGENARIMRGGLFNPVVLTEIELPSGQSYKFSYDLYGRIEWITYPTGGRERFTYGVIPTLSVLEPTDMSAQANFGVVAREVFESTNDQAPYRWTYSASYVEPQGYRTAIVNPDGTKVERYLHRGADPGSGIGTFGFENVLAGMSYEERTYDNAAPAHLIAQNLTVWSKTTLSGRADWHPRILLEESRIFNTLGNGVSAIRTFEYAGDLGQISTPLLRSSVSEYPFVVVGSEPPSNPIRKSESTFLIYDPNYSGVADYYRNQNMVGLVTVAKVKDQGGVTQSQSETVYDESGRSPGYRGNPTTTRIWDSTKGPVTNSNAYISTYAKYDAFGNQIETTDALGNTTKTRYDSIFNAFPIEVTSPVPDPSGQRGSSAAFITSTTFDPVTGLPLTTKDANGLETKIEYDPSTLRPIRTTFWYLGAQVGGTIETLYHDEKDNYWIKNRTQIDVGSWAESTTYFDGLGRAYKTEEVNSRGNIFSVKEFDAEGRVKRVSNPYRLDGDPCYQNGQVQCWTTNIYDEASRIREVILPDGSRVKTDYGVSILAPIGVTKEITDQAGKKRKGITDALGRMIRVIEDPAGQNLASDYVFDVLGNLRKTTQGEQNRYFMYDSLGRLLYAKQVEMDANPAFTASDPVTGN
ncbi:MAG: hypothetical protein C4287_23165, partial [Leptolyngbya sp. ERB_1_2]